MNDRVHNEDATFLYQAILQLQTVDECLAFFQDLCTVSELKAMTQRLAVAKQLHQNKTYTEISADTGASAATISRVNRCLEYGADGYKTILTRLVEED